MNDLLSPSARRLRRGRRGFTLIELLAVILIIGLLVAALTPQIVGAIETAKVEACAGNLRQIYQGMLQYQHKYKQSPNESGVKFFAQLVSRKAMENSEMNAKRLTCPAVQTSALTIGELPWEEWWTDLEMIDGSYSAYAGRDMREHPLRKFPALIADDNDPEMNHETATNCLYGDGNVIQYEIEVLRDEGMVGPEEQILIVGPGSPHPDLRKMSLD